MMIKTDFTQMKVDFLRQFDDYVLNKIGEESIIDYWYSYGLPEGYDYFDLIEIALDEELWTDVVKCFARCCKLAEIF